MFLWFFIKLNLTSAKELEFLGKNSASVSFMCLERRFLSLCDLQTEHVQSCQSDTFLIKLSHHVKAETVSS